MPHLTETKEIAAPPRRVFEAINNYGRRLEWDTLLRDAKVLSSTGQPLPLDTPLEKGMTIRSYARWLSGGVVMDTVYKLCEFPDAELEMVTGPWFFESFQASAHLKETPDGGTRWQSDYTFVCRPRILRSIVEPIVAWIFRRETRMRVDGMSRWLEAENRRQA
ncbi:MAG: SRPBCC family protein [Verrucomicrobiota bacterium]